MRRIDVWLIALDRPTDLAAALESLSSDERARYSRLATPMLRRHFALRRAALRRILAQVVGCQAHALPLGSGPNGRPALHSGDIDFNASHSGGLAMVAVSDSGRVGVDIEAVEPLPEAEHLLERFLSPAERSALQALPRHRWLRSLYATWTRKEALLKALGVGLSVPLDTFDVTVDAYAAPRLLGRRWPSDDGAAWSLETLPVPDGWVATVATDAGGSAARMRHWDGAAGT